jgi:ligand-binding SRPBCC domain-containing protein
MSVLIRREGDEYRLRAEQWLPRPVDEVFPFFADAHNLERITPPLLSFEVLTPGPIEMGRGTRIDYRLKLHGFPLRWRSEITAWEPPFRFVDEQLNGPYRRWIHEHRFAADGRGTRVTDEVRYAVPGPRFVHDLFVRRDLEAIFGYRNSSMLHLHGEEVPAT